MESQSRVNAIGKLAVAGEQAGLSLELMIQLLDSGMSVSALLDLIIWRLDPARGFSSQAVPLSGRSHEIRQPWEVAN
jgi:hypothetical protein